MKRQLIAVIGFVFFAAAATVYSAAGVKHYTETVDVKAGKETVKQKRWCLENDFVKFALTDDPGGAVVEFTNKENGVNHVVGTVYRSKTKTSGGYCWLDYEMDKKTDPVEKHFRYQKYTVEVIKEKDGNTTIKVIGKTAEQMIERWHTLAPDSGELIIRKKLTNTSDKERTLWMRWHPFMYASKDNFGRSGVIMSPGPGDQVRKVKLGWGWDHWFRTHDGYWIAEDYNTGDGIFLTFEKETTPIHFTWTIYGSANKKTKGAFTMEMFPEAKLKKAGESIETSLSFFPFSKDTAPEKFPLGVLKDKDERARALSFVKRVKPLENIKKFAAYSFARTAQFDWNHRRRDKFVVKEWGFADCAIIGYPQQQVPFKVRMVGGVFDKAADFKGFNKFWTKQNFVVKFINSDSKEIYKNSFTMDLKPGVEGAETFDREVAIPVKGIPDGEYDIIVEAIDLFTRKPIHSHSMKINVFGNRLKLEERKLSEELASGQRDRLFVKALANAEDVDVKSGKIVIPIGVEDGSGTERVGFPVRLGVPFPMGKFKPDAAARLLDSQGKEVEAAFSVMNIWQDKSLKWLQVEFPASCPADGFSFYKLEVGRGVKASKKDSIAADKGNYIEINTGPMLLKISKEKLNVPGLVYLDSNKDGTFAEDEIVSKESAQSDIWWEGLDNKRYLMQLKGPDSMIFKPGVTIESNSSQSAVVKLQGWYFDEGNKDKTTPAYGEIRIEAAKGKTVFKVWHQVTFTGSPWQDKLASYGLKMRIKKGLYDKVFYDINGKSVPSQGSTSLYQRSFNRVQLKSDGKTAAGGEKATGAVLLKGFNGSALFFHRELWQLYPKKIEADAAAGELSFHYWPKEAGVHTFEPEEEYWIPSSSSAEACGTGASRTHEIVVDFSNLVDVVDADNVYDEPVIAAVPPKWIQNTKVLRNLVPYNSEKMPEIETYITEHLKYFERNRDFFNFYGEWNYGTLHNNYKPSIYNWLIVGRYANLANEEDIVKGPWLAYFRSGNRFFFKFARKWTRHLMEVQSIRWHNTFKEFAGMSRRHHKTAWLGGGDWGHTMLCPWLEYYHATGYRPAWDMAKFTASTMANTYKGEWRYITNPLIGNIRMYAETADEKYKKVADRIWNNLCKNDRNKWFNASHAGRAVRFYSEFNKECLNDWKKFTDGAKTAAGKDITRFDYIDSLAELAERTGDIKYAHQARLNFELYRYYMYTGMTFGANPIYRGQVPYPSQHTLGRVRMITTGAEQVMRSKEAFPAECINIMAYGADIIMQEDEDQDIILWLSKQPGGKVNITGPDKKEIKFKEEVIFSGKGLHKGNSKVDFCKITIGKDKQTGTYTATLKSNLLHVGASLKKIAIDIKKSSLKGCGVPLYVKSESLGSGKTSFVMQGTPAASFGIYTLEGKKIFAKTYVRPAIDNVGIEHEVKLPQNSILEIRDRNGVYFNGIDKIRFYLNKDGIF
ncbi:MAG: exo-rhamnogalacturonan lyase family protein [Planctomycetota bacterium]|jgi:hypothetical protein